MKILIIEDDLILALSTEMMLKKLGYNEVYKATTGEEAVVIADEKKPDLLLVDIQLGPGITGVDAVKQIQRKRNVPALYITGNSDKINKNLADQTYYLEYMVKPITFTELKSVIETSHSVINR